MSRESMEAKLFWSLLDEAQGEDGLAFTVHCLSMALSLGGAELWRQLGESSGLDSVNSMRGDDSSSKTSSSSSADPSKRPQPGHASFVAPTVWLHLSVAKQATRLILVRALEPQLHATMEAIDALKESPDIENPLVTEYDVLAAEAAAAAANGNSAADAIAEGGGGVEGGDSVQKEEATHVDLFVWLRIMLQRFQEEQSHRAAAIRLMFDTASVGALTAVPPQPATGSNPLGGDSILASSTANGVSGGAGGPVSGSESVVFSTLGHSGAGGESHVEFPQFTAIVRTLHPSMSVTEVAALFGQCYERGERKVTANLFLKVAEQRRLFSRSMKLAPLPVLRRGGGYISAGRERRADRAPPAAAVSLCRR